MNQSENQSPINKKPVVEHPTAPEGFDTRTHIRDASTGALIRLQTHAVHFFGTEKMYEFPIGSGNMFSVQGHQIGRWEFQAIGGDPKKRQWMKIGDDHAFVPPAPANKLEAVEQENSALKAELEALRAEKEKKVEQAGKPVQAQGKA